jgi:PAS domain S-box-containing protein
MQVPKTYPQPTPLPMGERSKAKERWLLLSVDDLSILELRARGGVIERVSTTLNVLGGYKPADLVGRSYRDFIHPDDFELAAAAFGNVRQERQTDPMTLRYRRKDGSWQAVRVTCRDLVAGPASRTTVVLTRDVTAQSLAEASVAHANLRVHRLSQQLMVAHEAERSHIARELHDDVQQILFGLSLSMRGAPRDTGEAASDERVATWRRLVDEAFDHLRNLTLDLRPPVLDAHGLVAEVRAHVERLRLTMSRDIRLHVGPDIGRLAAATELACFRIVQEALANALKHSHASVTQVSIGRADDALGITISDNGCGFNVEAAEARAGRGGNIGLLSMRERAWLVGGHLGIRSSAEGTTVQVSIPSTLGIDAAADRSGSMHQCQPTDSANSLSIVR